MSRLGHSADGVLAGRSSLVRNDVVVTLAETHGASPAQIALASLLLRNDDVCAIPKASIHEHVHENARGLEVQLDGEDLKMLDGEFPPPKGPAPLDVYCESFC